MTTRSNIAVAINAAYEASEKAKGESIRYAIECGQLLRDAKGGAAHGTWDAWVKTNCSFSLRTAQLYMRLAQHVAEHPEEAQRVADLSLRQWAQSAAKPSNKSVAVANVAGWFDQHLPEHERPRVLAALRDSGNPSIAEAIEDLSR